MGNVLNKLLLPNALSQYVSLTGEIGGLHQKIALQAMPNMYGLLSETGRLWLKLGRATADDPETWLASLSKDAAEPTAASRTQHKHLSDLPWRKEISRILKGQKNTKVVELALMKDEEGFEQLPGTAVQPEKKSNSEFNTYPLSLP